MDRPDGLGARGQAQTSPGPTSIRPPSHSIVARPSSTTKVSSASTSVKLPGRAAPDAGLAALRRRRRARSAEVSRVALEHLLRVERVRLERRRGGGDRRDRAQPPVSSAAASSKAAVWRSTCSAVVAGRHQGHHVERRQQDAAVEHVEVQQRVEVLVHRRRRLGAVARRRRREHVLGAAAEAGDRPGQLALGDRRRDARPRSARRARSCARTPRRSAPRRASRATAASESALPASVPPTPPTSASSQKVWSTTRSATSARQAVGAGRDPAADRLADRQQVRLEAVGARCSRRARSRACGSRRSPAASRPRG